jgi:hypothetical protein
MNAGQVAQNAHLRGLAQGLDAGAGQGSPADLDDEVIEVAFEIRDELVAEGLAALDGQAVLGALGGEGQRAGFQLPPQPVVRRVTGQAGFARADGHFRAQITQLPDHPRVGAGRDEHGQRPAAGPGQHRRRQGRVPAAGDGQTGTVSGVGQAGGLHDSQVNEHAHEVPALVRARHVPRLVLDPHSAVCGEAQGVAQFAAAGKRGGAETVAVDAGDRRVERGHQVAVGGVGHAAGPGHVVGVHEGPVAQERVRLPVRLVAGREAGRGRAEHAGQHVVGVVGPGPRAPERRVTWAGHVAAPGAADDAPGCCHAARPARSLNSMIMASQAGSRSRRPAQNGGSRRASKSGSGTPCCSTQV